MNKFFLNLFLSLGLVFISVALASAQTSTAILTISNIRAENIINTSAQIKWTTNIPSNSRIYYGVNISNYTSSADNRCDDGGNVINHCINLTGLSQDTIYYFKVVSMDVAGLNSISNQYQFRSGTSSSDTGSGTIPSTPTPTPTPSSNPATPTPSTSPATNPTNSSQSTETIPQPPSNLNALLQGGKITLNWVDNSNNETEFRINRRLPGGYWALFRSISSNITYYIDNDVANNTYEYDVNACNSHGCSTYSNSALVAVGVLTTSSPTPTPSPNLGPSPSPTPNNETLPAILNGFVKFSNGQPITDAEVGAYSKDTGQWINASVNSSGGYTLNLKGGMWQINVRPKNPDQSRWTFSGQFIELDFRRTGEPETKTINITIPISDAELIVSVVDDRGISLANAGIVADTTSADQISTTANSGQSGYGKTDTNGRISLKLRGGTYHVRSFLPYESGYINPTEQVVTLANGETKNIKLIFIRKNTISEIFLKGTTRLENGNPTDAFIWAWSEKGRSANTRARDDGTFSIQVSPDDRWHVGAGKELERVPYKSSEVIIPIGNQTVSMELTLTKIKENLLLSPSAISANKATNQQITAQTGDGAKITVAANTISTTGGLVTVEVRPTIEAPSQPSTKVISTVYDISVKNQSGQQVKDFGQELEIELPYKDSDLKAQGVTDSNIMPSFFDDSSGAWVKIDNYNIDRSRHVIIARVSHLTRFAVVAAADVTPPSPPTSINAFTSGQGQINITWINPVQDFSHAKIYRSENSYTLGKLIAAEVQSNQFTDGQDIKDQITYYYVVRAVDPAGNETSNTSPVSVKATGNSSVLKDGDVISAVGSNDPDIYIVNDMGFKRLFLNPVIFGFYGHLGGFNKVKGVASSVRDSYKTSGLFRNCEINDPKVYGVQVTGEDMGILHWINTTGEQAVMDDSDFFKKVFCINNNEFNWYGKSSAYNSVNQIPSYSR